MAEFTKKNQKNRSNKNQTSTVIKNPGDFEYKMPKAMADVILKSEKNKKPAQEILCDHVNTLFGLKGRCIKVIVE